MSIRTISEDDLNGFVDQTLDNTRHAEVVAYLDAHPEIARRIAGFCEQRDQLRYALAPIMEEPVPPELAISSLIEERRRPHVPTHWAAVAASLAFLCFGTAGGWVLRGMAPGPSYGVEALAEEAAASYTAYAPDLVRPVEIRAEDRTVLAAWAAKRLGRPIGIPDLEASGYRLMGGRVVPTEHGPAAVFMYSDDRGTRLVMLSRPMAAEQSLPMSPHSRDGLNSFAWADNGLGYSLVGTVPAELLHPVADIARGQLRQPI